jgi:hypothetical protein
MYLIIIYLLLSGIINVKCIRTSFHFPPVTVYTLHYLLLPGIRQLCTLADSEHVGTLCYKVILLSDLSVSHLTISRSKDDDRETVKTP